MGACASTPKDEKSLRAVRYGSLSRPREKARVRELPQHSIFKGMDEKRSNLARSLRLSKEGAGTRSLSRLAPGITV